MTVEIECRQCHEMRQADVLYKPADVGLNVVVICNVCKTEYL